MSERKALGERAEDLFSEDSEEWHDLNGLSKSLIVKTEESEVLSPKSELKTEDKTDNTEDSKVLSSDTNKKDLGVKTEESEVLSPKSELKTEYKTDNTEDSKSLILKRKVRVGTKRTRTPRSKVIDKSESLKGLSLNSQAFDSAIEEAKRNPRIGIYSPISSAVLKYMKKTVPEYSISDDARLLLEDSVARKYPDLTKNLALEKGTPQTEDGEPNDNKYDMQFVERIASEIMKNPKLTVWSPYAYAVLKYLRKTQPEFSMSMEARILLEDAVARKYPSLVEAFTQASERAV
jgi:hypothetical protein